MCRARLRRAAGLTRTRPSWRRRPQRLPEAGFPLGGDLGSRLAGDQEAVEGQLAAEAEALHLDLLEEGAHQRLDFEGVVDVLMSHHQSVIEAVAQAEFQPG